MYTPSLNVGGAGAPATATIWHACPYSPFVPMPAKSARGARRPHDVQHRAEHDGEIHGERPMFQIVEIR